MNRLIIKNIGGFSAQSLVLTAAMGVVLPAAAQDLSIEEIVVTAQKREEGIQDVAISIAVVDGDAIEKYNAASAKDLVNLTSGILLEEHFGSNPVYVIRGIGLNDFRSNSSPSAAVYNDEVFQANLLTGSPQVFDMERVEILKGPQGTLYGRNASSGAVNVISKKPTDVFDGYAKAGYGRFDQVNVEGAFGGPINDQWMFRVAGQFNEFGESVYDNENALFSSEPRQVGPGEAYAPEDLGLRAQLLWRPAVGTGVLLKLSYRKQGGTFSNSIAVPTVQNPDSAIVCPGTDGPADSSARRGCLANIFGDITVIPPRGERTLNLNFVPELDVETLGLMARVDHVFEWATLTSITAYDTFDFFQDLDFDSTVGNGLNVRHEFEDEVFSQEFRLAGDSETVKWLAGVNAARDNYEEPVRLLYNGDFIGNNRGSANYIGAPGRVDVLSPHFDTRTEDANSLLQTVDQPTTSFAVFTDNELQLTDQLSLVVGYRYTYERREFEGAGFVLFTDGTAEFANQNNLGPAVGENELETKRSSGRIGINWQPSDGVLVYALLSESFKSGGFDSGFLSNVTFINTPYEAEVVRSFELGVKSDPLPNLRLNAAAFFTDFDSPQARLTVFTTGPGGEQIAQGILSNLDSADIFGVEADITWLPLEGLMLAASATYLDTEVSQKGENAATFDGNPLTHAPEFSGTLNGQYEFGLGDMLVGRLQANLKYIGDHMLRPEGLPIDEQEAITLVDAQLAVGAADDRWELAIYGRNLTDEAYRTSGIAGFGSIVYNLGLPRVWGISLTGRF